MQFRIALSLIVAIITIGCTARTPCPVPPVNRLQICTDIKRQLIFLNANDPTLQPFEYKAANWISPTRQALLMRKYRDFHCDEVLNECTPPAVHRLGVTPMPDDSRCPR